MSSSIELGLGVSPVLPAGEPGTPWSPDALGLRAWYDAELGQPKGVGYVQLDGTSGDYIYTPDAPNVDQTGDLELVMRVYCNDWSNGANQTLACKYVTTGNQRSWRLFTNSAGVLSIIASGDGTAGTLATAAITPLVALPDATWIWLRARLQLSNGVNSVGTLDTAADTGSNSVLPVSWTANGSATGIALASCFSSTSPVEIGSFATGTLERFAGRVGRCIVRDGFDGRTVADFNASDCYGPGYLNQGSLPTDGGGARYVPLRGVSGDYIWTADKAALRITGDIEIVARVAAADWTPAADQVIACRRQSSNWSYQMALEATTGKLTFSATSDGISAGLINAKSTASPVVADGAALWVKVTVNQSGNVVKFFTAADQATEPTVWAQLGSDVAITGIAMFAGTAPLEIGARHGGTLSLFVGSVIRVIVRSGIGGTTVADFNAANATAFGLPSDGVGNGWLIADPKHHGNWTLGLPKIYDRSGNGVAPATFGAGSNQPTWLPWRSAGVYLPGASGNYISCPDASALDITGDIDIVARVALADWTPSAPVTIVAKEQTVTQRSYRMQITTSGFISISFSIDGSASLGLAGSVAVPVLDGMTAWIRATRESASGRIRFYWYPDQEAEPTQWIQLGADANSTAGALFQSTSVLEIGSRVGGTTEVATGVMRRIIVRDGVGGTTVADFVAASCGQSGYTDTLGNVWTVNRATSGRKTVVQSPVAASARSVILFGTDDIADTPAAAQPPMNASQPYTWAGVMRAWDTHGNYARLWATRSTGGSVKGIEIGFDASGSNRLAMFTADGSSQANSGVAWTPGQRSVLIGSASGANVQVFNNMAAGSAVGQRADTDSGTAGRVGSATGSILAVIDAEITALFSRDVATTDTERGQLVAYYRGGL